jgi:hypothetical protein
MGTIQTEIAKKVAREYTSATYVHSTIIDEIQAYKCEHAAKNTYDPGINPKPKKPIKGTADKNITEMA